MFVISEAWPPGFPTNKAVWTEIVKKMTFISSPLVQIFPQKDIKDPIKNKINFPFAITWIGLEGIMLSEIKKKYKYCMQSLIHGL